jgi:hypothetical protein
VEHTVSDAISQTQHLCQAYPSNGPWYINVRFNYTRCSWGGGSGCGYVGTLYFKPF